MREKQALVVNVISSQKTGYEAGILTSLRNKQEETL